MDPEPDPSVHPSGTVSRHRRKGPGWRLSGQGLRRPAWLRSLGLTLAPFLLLQGCGGNVRTPTTLHVLIVPNSSLEWYRSFYQEALPETDLLKAFRKLNPEVSIDISTVSESDLETRLRLSKSRGLGPDLLILHGPKAISLLEQGLLQPLPRKDPQLQLALSQVAPDLLNHAQGSRGLAGIPLFAEVTVACFDRRRITEPPTTLSNLLTVAAAGNPVGLSVDPSGIYWTAGALGAAQALKPILLPDTGKPEAALLTSQKQDLQRWLDWLRQSALQGKVYLGSGPEDLVTGLESGRLAWIPCFSPLLVRLNRTMGRHLGVAPLPDGPLGPASPFLSNRIMALGTDSTPDQRKLTLQLMELALDPALQRKTTVTSRYTIPSNRYVSIPVASSSQLAALSTAYNQFLQTAWIRTSYSEGELDRTLPKVDSLVNLVMEGIVSPDEGAEQILRLQPRRP